jgi:hypothetical protein
MGSIRLICRTTAALLGAAIPVMVPSVASATTYPSVYVAGLNGVDASAASDTNNCSQQATPCATLAGALGQAASSGTVYVSGVITETSATNVNQTVTIAANPDGASATIQALNNNDSNGLLNVGDFDVSIQGLTFLDGYSTTSGSSGGVTLAGGGTLSINDSTFQSDTDTTAGAALLVNTNAGPSASVDVTDSSFILDSTTLFGGAITTAGRSGGNAQLSISGSTFTDDAAGTVGGAIRNFATGSGSVSNVTVVNSTFDSNTGTNDAGAIQNTTSSGGSAEITVADSTLSGSAAGNNGATLISNGGGPIYLAGDDINGTCDGSGYQDYGYNAATGSSCLNGTTASTDTVGAAGDLGSPADNGGLTQTMALTAGNPAINLIPATPTSVSVPSGTTLSATVSCPVTVDQRELANPAANGYCDAGAVQYAPQSITIAAGTPADVVVGQAGVALSASSTSGLAVGYEVDPATTNNACTVSGSTVRFAHAGSCVIDATQGGNANFTPASNVPVQITVGSAQTTVTLSSSGGRLIATVSLNAPASGAATGTVAFLAGGQTIGTSPLVNGVATLEYTAPAGSTESITAEYQGSSDATVSNATTTVNGAAPASNPAPVAKRPIVDPVITAKLSSAEPRSPNGWWRSPVKVTFSCDAKGEVLIGGCPSAVTLAQSGTNQTLSRTIRTDGGGNGSVKVSGINIDMTRPTVRITGPSERGSYLLSAPAAECVAKDGVSRVRSCRLSEHTARTAMGLLITYSANAISNAGTTATAELTVHVQTVALLAREQVSGAYDVTSGDTYTLEVLSNTMPTYLDAAVAPQLPSPGHDYFQRAGSLNGVKVWKLHVRIEQGFSRFPSWTIGVRIGSVVQTLKLES